MSLASLPALIRDLHVTREPDASTAAVPNLREKLRVIHEQLAATPEDITAVADDREAAVEMYYHMQISITGGRRGEAAGLATSTGGWRRAAAGSDKKSLESSRLRSLICSIVCMYV